MQMAHEPPLTQTRTQIIDVLLRRPDSRVSELSEELNIAAGSLRRHLDILIAEGYVTARPVRRGQGRPYFVYSPTDRAKDAASTGYGRLFERMFREFAMLPSEQLRGADGAKILDLVFDRLGADLAEEYRAQVNAPTLAGRVRQVTEALAKEGVLSGWEELPDGFHLRNGACPYRRAAMVTHGPCTSERDAIERLVGAPVKQTSRIVDGTPICEYVVELTGAGRQGEAQLTTTKGE
jgi:predicted ArsR family transcriptional regulator